VALGDAPLIGACLLRLLSLLSGFGFRLALLLSLHFSPDADKTGGSTTHVVQALPEALWLSPQPAVTRRL
jgi:hypothetical protein